MMDNPLNSSIRLLPPSRLIFLILPPLLLLQICPPTREYPRVFTGATDTGVPCHFPEALKHIEAKCHGQVRRDLVCCILSFVIVAPSSRPGAVLDDHGARGVRRHVLGHVRPLPRLQEVRRGRLQVPPDAVQGREVETETAQK